jgi:hypothetical protein
VATDRETTQGSLAAVRYWASGISAVYLDGALERARAMLPEARLARRHAQAEGEEALAQAEAAAYEAATHAARKAALDADRRRRETEAMREFMRKHSSERRHASQPSAHAHAHNRARVSRRPHASPEYS